MWAFLWGGRVCPPHARHWSQHWFPPSLVSRWHAAPRLQPTLAARCPEVKPELLTVDPRIPPWPHYIFLTPQTLAMQTIWTYQAILCQFMHHSLYLEHFTFHNHLWDTYLPFKTWVGDTFPTDPHSRRSASTWCIANTPYMFARAVSKPMLCFLNVFLPSTTSAFFL